MIVSGKDRARLRALANQQVEIAHSTKMELLRRDWTKHGAFNADSRPMVRMELGTFAPDILPTLQQCEGADARGLEWWLLSNTVNHTLFGDDTLVEDFLPVSPSTWFRAFGLRVERTVAVQGLGHQFHAQLKDLEKDFHKLGASEYGLNLAAVEPRIDELNELFGDILPARRVGFSLVCSPTQDIVHIMDMQDMYMAIYDAPELFHEMMRRLTDEYIEFFAHLSRENALRATTGSEHLCQGTYCFTDELPNRPGQMQSTDIWGYMDSQETSGISPAMYKEFILPYYKRVAERFGLLSYGCCEGVSAIWDDCLDTIPNMRKVSISPWCDEDKMGERLRGRRIVYLRKPTPNLLGVGNVLDEDAVRAHIQKTVLAARGCALEIAQRDVYQIHAGPEKVRRYVELIRAELDRHVR